MPKVSPLEEHLEALSKCRRCSGMQPPPITPGPVCSRVLLVGQAPGAREPVLGRPFAWTAGKTLFKWMKEATSLDEERVYISAVCRCFPGKNPKGGDRVPNQTEIAACRPWLEAEMELLKPKLVLPIGKLAISQFMPVNKLVDVIGDCHADIKWRGHRFDIVPLPHPSGASTWHRMAPGKALTEQALAVLATHPAISDLR
jgi:uracil-DNA glycosylase